MRSSSQGIRAYTTKRGARILQHGTVLSEVLKNPGPTHSVVDVMAAGIEILSPGLDVALLGFSGGGLLGPLRALRGRHRITALDMDDHGFELFEKHCRPWAGTVRLRHVEAGRWLRKTKRRYDLMAVDLSISCEGEVQTPSLVWEELPGLVAERLKPDGVAMFNLLRPVNMTWGEGIKRVAKPFSSAWQISLQDFENRLMLLGNMTGTARDLESQIRTLLAGIGSNQATRISVRNAGRVKA